jgi:hypothetical protein
MDLEDCWPWPVTSNSVSTIDMDTKLTKCHYQGMQANGFKILFAIYILKKHQKLWRFDASLSF